MTGKIIYYIISSNNSHGIKSKLSLLKLLDQFLSLSHTFIHLQFLCRWINMCFCLWSGVREIINEMKLVNITLLVIWQGLWQFFLNCFLSQGSLIADITDWEAIISHLLTDDCVNEREKNPYHCWYAMTHFWHFRGRWTFWYNEKLG